MGMTVVTKLPSDAELKKMFDAVPALEKYNVADAVVRAGIKPIARRARSLTVRSKAADRAKWSKERKEGKGRWGGLTPPLRKSVKSVVRKGRKASALAVAGPDWTGKGGVGQKVFFIYEHKQKGRRMMFWGRDGKRTALKHRNMMVQAAEETRQEQLAAMKTMLRKKMDEVWRG